MAQHWRYRQQAPPLKAHLWVSPQETLCGRSGRAQVSGNYNVKEEERCRLCLGMSKVNDSAI